MKKEELYFEPIQGTGYAAKGEDGTNVIIVNQSLPAEKIPKVVSKLETKISKSNF